MKVQKIASLVLASVATITTTWSHAQELPKNAEVKSTGKLRLSNSLAYAPFEYLDERGVAAGLNIELAKAVAAALGVELDLVRAPFSTQIPGLASGRAKVALASFTVTAERLKQVDFITYLKAGTVLVTTKENAGQFKSQDDLCGKQLAIQTGAAADFAADKISAACKARGKEEIKKAIYPEQKDTIQAVITGRVVGRLEDSTSSAYYVAQTNGKMVIAPGEYFPLPLGVAVTKGDKESAEMMRAALQKLISDGTYKAILTKYGMDIAAIEKSEVITSAEQLPKH